MTPLCFASLHLHQVGRGQVRKGGEAARETLAKMLSLLNPLAKGRASAPKTPE